jgi:uncharacterized protein involved in exopolysaccharide biosynthesis
MHEISTANKSSSEPGGNTSGERVVYVMPEQAFERASDTEISIRELWEILWRRKWIFLSITFSFAVGSVTYSLLATEWYRAEVLLAPAEAQSMQSLGGQLGGLAALAGVSVGGSDSIEAIATLKSREFARQFIEEFNLLTVFFADEWDVERSRWLSDDPKKWPDIRDAIEYFHDNVLDVSEDLQTGLVTLSIEWTDPNLAAAWADTLVQRLNTRLRERALREAETNVAFLQAELAQTSVVSLQQSIGRLLESELQKLMLAGGNVEFAFRVVDTAAAPKKHVRPKRALIAIVGTILGGILATSVILILHAIRPASARPRDQCVSGVSG